MPNKQCSFSPLRLNRHAGADTVPVSHERHHRRRTRRICGRLTPKKRPRTPLLQPTGHLRHLRRRPMARTLQRTPVRVKPVAAPNGTVHLDDIIQHHPRSQQRSQRMPAGTVSKSTRYSRLPKSNDANSKLHTSVRCAIKPLIAQLLLSGIRPRSPLRRPLVTTTGGSLQIVPQSPSSAPARRAADRASPPPWSPSSPTTPTASTRPSGSFLTNGAAT